MRLRLLGTSLIVMVLTLWFFGCAHKQAQQPASKQIPDINLSQTQESAQVTTTSSELELPKVLDPELEQIPIDEHVLVEKWIAYFQGKGRPHMERYLARSSIYSKIMKKILRQNGLPEDLIFIALIESGFNWKATSRAAAVGPWQFIRGTGRRYSLEVNAFVDERRDPILSTQAAAEYFKGLYSVFGSWYLAMASYNVGENRVKREVMNSYTRDFWELARKRRLPKETINYIPKFIAAKLIGNNPAKYGFADIEYLPAMEFELLTLSKSVNLRKMAENMGIEYDDLKQLNPKFRGEIAPLKEGRSLELRIPVGQQQIALAAAETSFVDRMTYVADTGEFKTHRVKSGESLYTIAKRYRTTVAFLRDANDLPRKRRLRIGMKVLVPDHGMSKGIGKETIKKVAYNKTVAEKGEDVEKANVRAEEVTQKGIFYIVQPGDNLSSIAQEYDSSVMELRKMNKIPKGAILKVGMRLRVPKEDVGLPSDLPGTGNSSEDRSFARRSVAEQSSSEEIKKIQEPTHHIVKPGESLVKIAHKYGLSLQKLRKANRLSKSSKISIGMKLVIPVVKRTSFNSKIHVVQRGESLSRIAQKHKVSVSSLKEKNHLANKSKLFVGSRLLIPNSSRTASSVQ